ncbi:MAG: hypothetical protein ACM31L_12000 [Actinomycetota bacterium]
MDKAILARALKVVAPTTIALILAIAAYDFYLTFPWRLRGGVLYEAALRDRLGTTLGEYAAPLLAAVAAALCAAFSDRLSKAVLAIALIAAAGLLMLYGAAGLLMVSFQTNH